MRLRRKGGGLAKARSTPTVGGSLGYHVALAVLVVSSSASPALAQSETLTGFVAEVSAGDGGACRALLVEQRTENWYGPSVAEAFASVEEIMADVTGGPEFASLGCDRDFRAMFMDCTRLDNPEKRHIVPRGVSAATEAEQVALMRGCFEALGSIGLKP